MSDTDPFAVSQYDLAALPDGSKLDVDFGLRGTDGLPGFGPVWLEHLGGLEPASRRVRAAIQDQPVTVWLRDSPVRVVPTTGDIKAQKLAVVALLDLMEDGDRVPHHLARALVAVLGMETRAARRSDASVAAGLRGAHAVHGWNATQALAAGTTLTGQSASSLRTYQRSPGFSARVGAAQGRAFEDLAISGGTARPFWSTNHRAGRPYETRVPAPSDVWFAAGAEDSVAAEIVQRVIKDGKATSDVRWDLLNLFEGYFRRRWAPDEAAIAALAHVLGLVDIEGHPRRVPLAGVVYRREFMLSADVAAATATSERSASRLSYRVKAGKPGKAVVTGWRAHTMFEPAVTAVRRPQ